MRIRNLSPLLVLVALLTLAPAAEAVEHRLGIGAHFWKTVDDIADDIGDDSFANIEDDGFALVISYQRIPRGIFRLELDLEIYDEGFGGTDDTAFAPIAFVLVGHGLYAGVGAGITFSDGFDGNASDPFYVARVGWEFDVLPKLTLDINANYRSGAFDELDQFETDAITLGAILRF